MVADRLGHAQLESAARRLRAAHEALERVAGLGAEVRRRICAELHEAERHYIALRTVAAAAPAG